jgi:hypothetical protein
VAVWGVEAVEFRVDLVGVKVAGADAYSDDADLVEDVQALLPGVACGVVVAGSVVRIAEEVQKLGEVDLEA